MRCLYVRLCNVPLVIIPVIIHQIKYQQFIDYLPTHTQFNPPETFSLKQPALLQLFDCRFDEHDRFEDTLGIGCWHPTRTSILYPDKLREFLIYIESTYNESHGNDRVVVFADHEFPLSTAFGRDDAERAATVARLQKYFRRILYMSPDIRLEGVTTLPGGLMERYVRFKNHEAMRCVTASGIDAASKPYAVLGAWGSYEGPSRVETWTKEEYVHLAKLHRWYKPGLEIFVDEAKRSKREARLWATSEAGREAGVVLYTVPQFLWWAVLSKYRFLMTPSGTNAHAPRAIEALLVFTVPIVQRGPFPYWDDLVAFGFPIVVVSQWSEINSTTLSEWWSSLSPRLNSFRDNCLITSTYWRFIIGEISTCA